MGSAQTVRTTRSEKAPSSLAACMFAIVGLAFLWPCLGSSATMSFRHAMANSASVITGEWHAVVMSTLYLLAIGGALVTRRRLEDLWTSPRRGWIVGVLGALGLLGHLLLIGSPSMGSSIPLVTLIVVIGFALSIAWIVGHILAWGSFLASMPVEHGLLVVVASNTLSYGLQLGCDSLSAGILLALLTLGPVGSAMGWIGANRQDHAPASDLESLGLAPAIKGLPWKLLVPAITLIYFEQVFSSLLFKRYALWPRDNLTVTVAVGCILWLAASLYLGKLFFRQSPSTGCKTTPKSALTGLFAALLVVYLGALLATLMFPQGNGLVVERFLVAAGSSFRVLLWLAIVVAVDRRSTTPTVGYLSYVLFVLALPISRLMALVLDLIPPKVIATLTSPTVIVAAAGVMLFLIAAVFIMGSVRKETAAPTATPDPVHSLASKASLSPRETEVLELVCRGFTAKRAGEKLGISESTVVSHMTHIYRKLGVSSKQELVALVEEQG